MRIILLAFILLTIGCQSTSKKKEISSDKLDELYYNSQGEGHKKSIEHMEESFRMKRGYSTMKNYYPVMIPPMSARVWVPNLRNYEDDALIVGHIVFLKVYDDQWGFDVEDENDPHHFSNLRKLKLPKVDAEVRNSTYKPKKIRGRNNYSVPVTLEDNK